MQLAVKKVKYLICCTYNGASFDGWEIQTQGRTIRGLIESYLNKTLKTKLKIESCSRTDKGVHAKKNYFSFTFNDMPISSWNNIFKGIQDNDFKVLNIKKVSDDFNIKNVEYKTYEYVISKKEVNVMDCHKYYYYNKPINLAKLKKSADLFVGKKSFLSFSVSTQEEHIKTIYSFNIKENKSFYIFTIKGSGFLRYQIRMMVAYLLKINENIVDDKKLKNLLDKPKKGSSVYLVPGSGLYLNDVKFKK